MNKIKNFIRLKILFLRGSFIRLEACSNFLQTFFNKTTKLLNAFNIWFEPVANNWLKDLEEPVKEEILEEPPKVIEEEIDNLEKEEIVEEPSEIIEEEIDEEDTEEYWIEQMKEVERFQDELSQLTDDQLIEEAQGLTEQNLIDDYYYYIPVFNDPLKDRIYKLFCIAYHPDTNGNIHDDRFDIWQQLSKPKEVKSTLDILKKINLEKNNPYYVLDHKFGGIIRPEIHHKKLHLFMLIANYKRRLKENESTS